MKKFAVKPCVNALDNGAVIGFQQGNFLLLLLFQLRQLTFAFLHKLLLYSLALFAKLHHRSFRLRYRCLQRFGLGALAFQLSLRNKYEYQNKN